MSFRVLSLDGGGVKGTFAAAFLTGVEEATNKRLVDYFDLIVGTSTGGILAIGLGLGLSAAELLSFYEAEGPRIFPNTGIRERAGRRLRHLWRPKYDQQRLREALRRAFGERLLGEARCRLVIPSFDAVSGDVHLFKTAHAARLTQDYKLRAEDVALATSAASTFLPAFGDSKGQWFVDGGVWANCPAALGVVEAHVVLGERLDAIHVLSVGTTDAPYSVSPTRRLGGALQWISQSGLVELLLQSQQRASLALARLLTSHVRLMRVDAAVTPKRFSIDSSSPKSIGDLKALGLREARHRSEEVDSRFLTGPAAPFVPCHLP